VFFLEYTQIPKVFFMPHLCTHFLTLPREEIIRADDTRGHDVIMHAQKIMGNGIIIIPPHNFMHPSWWYYQLYELKKYDFGWASNDIMSITNVIKLHPAILKLLHAYRWTWDMHKTNDVITHAQDKYGFIIIPPHTLCICHLGITNYWILKSTTYFGLASNA
jgi:hypothetical protein